MTSVTNVLVPFLTWSVKTNSQRPPRPQPAVVVPITPEEIVSQAFHIVPNASSPPAACNIWSKLPSKLITICGSLFTSNHSSPDGSNSSTPTQVKKYAA